MKKNKFLLLFAFALFVLLPSNINAMKIFIQTPEGENVSIEVETSDTIEAIKEKIFRVNNTFLISEQRLYFNNLEMTDGRTLGDYVGITVGSIIELEIAKDASVNIILNANGGVFIDNKEEYIIKDFYRTGELVYPTRRGYIFKGYYTEKNGGIKFEMILNEAGIDNDMTFYAQWEKTAVFVPSNPEEENPQTFDKIENNIIMGTMALIGLVGVTIYLKKRNQVSV